MTCAWPWQSVTKIDWINSIDFAELAYSTFRYRLQIKFNRLLFRQHISYDHFYNLMYVCFFSFSSFPMLACSFPDDDNGTGSVPLSRLRQHKQHYE